MHYISSSSMQIQWNLKLTSNFRPERGIQEGDPLSPYLFVLAMEHLGHCIDQLISDGHRVSVKKSQIYFSQTPVLILCSSICNYMEFQQVETLGKYLGVSTSVQTDFILDKKWGGNHTLCMAGRITVAKYVIPSYFMETVHLLVGVCNEIDKIIRFFS
ncbi:hypothetical protein V6N11_018333 [Hibiscus sabdariffa]|uniref:Reverse transcriptase domain-containing protein n=1 Tax=Hibiscus sabdariffa TaxID=183260 RepID=A0ABR2T730_9ROSI